MALTLPHVMENKKLTYNHFPTHMQCFIYRNWEIVPPVKMAQILDTDEETILNLAADMGLDININVDPIWYESGYITIIRNNWHLLTYNQLCLLLDWNIDKLAYIIKEDDFLYVKLGNFKPDCPTLKYQPLTDEQVIKTKFIKKVTLEIKKQLDPVTVSPFDFKEMFKRNIIPNDRRYYEDRFDTRIVYSYCALYGDTFISGMDYSFPDELLAAYSAIGVNGIWCQAVLYTLVPFTFMPELSDGYEKRLDGLRSLTEKMKRYGIKLYLYLNEPRSMPHEFFDKYPYLKGADNGDYCTMCTSTPEVQEYLFNSTKKLIEEVPELGGFITITASENFTNCYSHFSKQNQKCPLCSKREKYEVIAEVNTLLYKGAASVNPDIKFLAWTWGWNPEEINATIDLMPEKIGVMTVSESYIKKTIGSIETSVLDYSISIVGPGENAIGIWSHANSAGHRAYAKVQLNNTWECGAVPFLPVFEQVYQHVLNLIENGVGGLMLDWTLGGYPSPTFAMLKKLFYKSETIPTLEELYRSVFPSDCVDIIKSAVHLFSNAFDKYPFHVSTVYNAPHNVGASNLLYSEATGFNATMVCYPYDDVNSWRSIYPADVYENQFKLLSEEWSEGLDILKQLGMEKIKSTPILSELYDVSEAAYCHFRSVYLQTVFVRLRDSGETYNHVVEEEAMLAIRLANVEARNPTIGYESSNHYYYTRAMLMEKYINCKDILCEK
jgi:hypothetical protein